MLIIDIVAAQNQLPNLLEAANGGEQVVITQEGRPAAKLVPIRPQTRLRQPGSMADKIWIAEDFDAPLPDDMQAAFEGK